MKVSAASASLKVGLDNRAYSIEIEAGLLTSRRAAATLAEFTATGRLCFVTHPALRKLYVDPLVDLLAEYGVTPTILTLPPGERHKNLKTAARLYSDFVDARLDRKSLVVALGGGVLGDIAGFAAATYLRGIRIVQAPTTLLAQVDSSVGGKTGVDLPAGKNLVGAFHQPTTVLIDPRTLLTLPTPELRSGLSEVIKYGIIADAGFLREIVAWLPQLLRRDMDALTRVITRSCEIKSEVVTQDETENGLRVVLNFGHTIGHALESVTDYRRYRHGEAVAIGMVSAALIGEEIGVTPPEATREIVEALRKARLPVVFPADIDTTLILQATEHDKKAEAGRLRFVLVPRLGETIVTADVSHSAIKTALARQKQWTDT